MAENIYPIFEKMLQRKDREALLKQKGIMIWFTGLSGSGKSTLAIALERELYKQGILCRILDGDNIRSGINNNLGFSEADRTENIRRIAEVSKLFVDCGIVTIAAFIRHTFFSFKEKGMIDNPRITLSTDYRNLDIKSPLVAEQGKAR